MRRASENRNAQRVEQQPSPPLQGLGLRLDGFVAVASSVFVLFGLSIHSQADRECSADVAQASRRQLRMAKKRLSFSALLSLTSFNSERFGSSRSCSTASPSSRRCASFDPALKT